MNRRERTKENKKWGRLAVLVALVFGIVFALSGVSTAMDDEDMASDVLQAVLVDQGVELPDEPLQERLQTELQEAIRVGAILWETLNELGFRWTESGPHESATSSATSFPDEAIRQRLRERIREQLSIWAVIGPEWREAFEQLRERVRDCRESGDIECWRELRLQLQYEHARRFEETFENRYQEMQSTGGSTGELGQLERLREQTQERVETMIQDSTPNQLDGAGVELGDLERLRERLQDQMQVHVSTAPASTTSSGPTTSQVGPGSTDGSQQSGQGGN